jgi:hypothetical protein
MSLRQAKVERVLSSEYVMRHLLSSMCMFPSQALVLTRERVWRFRRCEAVSSCSQWELWWGAHRFAIRSFLMGLRGGLDALAAIFASCY